MSKSAMIRVRVTPELKQQAEDVLSELGISASDAVSMLYAQIVRTRSIPFPVTLEEVPPKRESVRQPAWHLNDVLDRVDRLDQWRRFRQDLSGFQFRE